MHKHPCRKCKFEFHCSEPADECFLEAITCNDCFWKYEAFNWMILLVLVAAAGGLTIVLFRLLRG